MTTTLGERNAARRYPKPLIKSPNASSRSGHGPCLDATLMWPASPASVGFASKRGVRFTLDVCYNIRL